METKGASGTPKQRRLRSLTRTCGLVLSEAQSLGESLMEESPFRHRIYDLISRYIAARETLASFPPEDFPSMRDFLSAHYFPVLQATERLFSQMAPDRERSVFTLDKWKERDKVTLFFANYVMMRQNYRALRDLVSAHFVDTYKSTYELVCDDASPLFDTHGLHSMRIPSETTRIRPSANLIAETLRLRTRIGEDEARVLEEQVSELIKNAVVHGNKKDPTKEVRIWYGTDDYAFRIIVEDEGPGFQRLEEWNEFNRKRNAALQKGDMDEILGYMQFKTPESTDADGGNALFAAVEYWDSSLVYNRRRNKVAALKYIRNLRQSVSA